MEREALSLDIAMRRMRQAKHELERAARNATALRAATEEVLARLNGTTTPPGKVRDADHVSETRGVRESVASVPPS